MDKQTVENYIAHLLDSNEISLPIEYKVAVKELRKENQILNNKLNNILEVIFSLNKQEVASARPYFGAIQQIKDILKDNMTKSLKEK